MPFVLLLLRISGFATEYIQKKGRIVNQPCMANLEVREQTNALLPDLPANGGDRSVGGTVIAGITRAHIMLKHGSSYSKWLDVGAGITNYVG